LERANCFSHFPPLLDQVRSVTWFCSFPAFVGRPDTPFSPVPPLSVGRASVFRGARAVGTMIRLPTGRMTIPRPPFVGVRLFRWSVFPPLSLQSTYAPRVRSVSSRVCQLFFSVAIESGAPHYLTSAEPNFLRAFLASRLITHLGSLQWFCILSAAGGPVFPLFILCSCS